jgi:hypothetical protein
MSSTEPPSRWHPKPSVSQTGQHGKEKHPLKIEGDDAKKRKFDRHYQEEKKAAKAEKKPNVFDMQKESVKSASKKEAPSPVDLFLESQVDEKGKPIAKEGKSELPQSAKFWDHVDLPPDQPLPSPHLEQKLSKLEKGAPPKIVERKKEAKQMPALNWEESLQEPSDEMPVADPREVEKHPAILQPKEKGHLAERPHLSKKELEQAKKEARDAHPAFHTEKKEAHPSFHAEKKEGLGKTAFERPQERERVSKEGREEAVEMPAERPLSRRESTGKQERHETRKGDRKGQREEEVQSAPFISERSSVSRERKEEVEEIVAPAKGKKRQNEDLEASPILSFPPTVERVAVAAVQQAAPYLSPQIRPLFFQMVGTMVIMSTPPGITRTEVVLNNPQMAGSRFYGTKITLEKYATAPDSYNIRLTGTPEAVATFQANASSLMQAFRQGRFDFKVNRLDTEYEAPTAQQRRRGGRENEAGSGGAGERER